MYNENPQTSSSTHTRNPVLSLILCSGNDQCTGNPRWRLQTSLNYLAQNVHELGREEEVEIIVADWGSEVPLHTLLQLSPVAAKMVSFVVIPPALARELRKDSPFSEVHALNAAARRVNGQYIGRIDHDTLVGKQFLNTFFELYEGTRALDVPLNSALLFANRRRIPQRFADRCLSFWAVNQFLRWFGRFLRVENHLKKDSSFFDCSYAGIWLLHRDLWDECGGYDERLINSNEIESDMAARLMGKYKMTNLGKLVDYDFYHLSHFDHQKWHTEDPCYTSGASHPNGKDWGLILYPLEMLPCSPNGSVSKSARRNQPILEWPLFILLLLIAGAQIMLDRLPIMLDRLQIMLGRVTHFLTDEERLVLIRSAIIRGRRFQLRKSNLGSKRYLIVGTGPALPLNESFINLDYYWRPNLDLCWDITKEQPLEDNSLSGIFMEHTLEHLSYLDGKNVLMCCYRMLRPGGTLRLSVPDFEIYLEVYRRRKLGERIIFPYGYLDKLGAYGETPSDTTPMMVINVMSRGAGERVDYSHKFTYDYETLELMLRRCGFVNIRRESFMRGRDTVLLIDYEERADESLYVEASKPFE
jgi:SAM-dependent methyltransferase